MKKYMYFIPLVFILVLMCGCNAQKTLTFNMPYDEVYEKTIQYLGYKTYSVEYANKELKSITAIVFTYESTKDKVSFVFSQKEGRTEVIVSAVGKTTNGIFWWGNTAVDEYERYITTGNTNAPKQPSSFMPEPIIK